MQANVTLSLFSSDSNPAKNKTVDSTLTTEWDKLPEILISRNWSPAIFENKARNLANYKQHPSLFAFDIDEGMTLLEAKEKFKDHCCIIYTSRNHQKIKHQGQPAEKPACDRFRVVFKLSEPILSDEDFKATWDAYFDKYPLDKQTRSSSMFFFKGVEVVFNNPSGKPLQVVKSADWQDIKSDTYSFTKDDRNPTKGVLSARSVKFLASGAPAGMFNISLFKCAVDHLEQRYTEQEFMGRLQEMVKANIISELDNTDLACIRCAYDREPKYGARVSGISQIDAQKRDIAEKIMDGEFIQCVLSDQTVWYKITDFENKEVERVANEQILERYISTEIKKPENHYNSVARSKDKDGREIQRPVTKPLKVDEVLELWRLDGKAMPTLPEPILWRGVEGWCHRRMNFDLVAGLPHPAWDEFLGRISEPEVFKAWVFSCFVPEHETRQALWFYGPNGEDGKTKVINVVAEQFGDAAASLSGGQLKGDSRFFLSQFLGKRIVVYPDCTRASFPQDEVFRNLTGGDNVSMEFKRGGFIHGVLKTKVIIGSNFEPQMTHANYDQSRLIVIDVKPSPETNDPTWPRRLKDEMPNFLGDCQVSYRKLCPNHGKITVPDRLKERLGHIAEVGQEDLQHIFDEYFVTCDVEPGVKWVSTKQLRNVLSRGGRRDAEVNSLVIKFKRFVETKHGVRKFRRADNKWHYEFLVFKDEKQAELFDKGAF